MKRSIVLLAAVAVSLVLASSALAFDCIRVSSSPTGMTMSSGSGKWFAITLDELVASLPATDAQQQCILDGAAEAGLPTVVAIGTGPGGPDHVIAGRNPDPNGVLGNGKGIDHLEDLYGPLLVACGVQIPSA